MTSLDADNQPDWSVIRELNHRARMANDLGAMAVGMPDAFETAESRQIYEQRLREEQPELYDDIRKLEGMRNVVTAIRRPRVR